MSNGKNGTRTERVVLAFLGALGWLCAAEELQRSTTSGGGVKYATFIVVVLLGWGIYRAGLRVNWQAVRSVFGWKEADE